MLFLVTHRKSERRYSVDSSQDIMTKVHQKTIGMQRNYPRMFSPADDQDREGFEFENVWRTFSNFAVVTH